uniref:Synaptotagmin 10 n=1 Tax=Leptobrachium leishanense TaxID=445787 RepID=A0A8C5MGT8_9ANUR
MSFHKEDGVSLCQKALQIVSELCLGGQVEWDKCTGIFPRSSQGAGSTDISVSLLAVVVSFCGLALLVVSLFVFWKLCWPCWRRKPVTCTSNMAPQCIPSAPPEVVETDEKKEFKQNGKASVKVAEAAMKISHTSPDIPAEVQSALKEHLMKRARVQRQITEPTSSSRSKCSVFQCINECDLMPPQTRRIDPTTSSNRHI